MVCRFDLCGYLFFGLRISFTDCKIYLHVYLWDYFCSNHLSQMKELCKTFSGIYSAEVLPYSIYICVTCDLLTQHNRKYPLGNTSGPRPTTVAQPLFLPTCKPWRWCLRLLQPSLCYRGTYFLKLCENLHLFFLAWQVCLVYHESSSANWNVTMV